MKKLLYILSFVIVVSCGNSKKIENNNINSINTSILVDDFSEYSRTSSNTQILNATIHDSTLTISVSYSGGCKNHDFQLIGSKMIQKSLPPIRGIMLIHHSNNDDCRELIERDLKFNISNLKYPNGDIVLKLQGYKPRILFESID